MSQLFEQDDFLSTKIETLSNYFEKEGIEIDSCFVSTYKPAYVNAIIIFVEGYKCTIYFKSPFRLKNMEHLKELKASCLSSVDIKSKIIVEISMYKE